jgi:hypothetical protein
VGIDVLGFLPTSDEGFKKLLVMTCLFTRYRVAVALHTEEATEIVQAINTHWVMLWGAPARWRCDNGAAFTSQLSRNYAAGYSSYVDYTLSANPTANGSTERANCSYLAMLRSKLQHYKHQWPQTVLLVSQAFNTSRVAGTDQVPHNMMARTVHRGLFSRATALQLELAVGETHTEWRRRQSRLEQIMFDDVRTRLNDAWIATRQQQADWTPGWTPQPHDLCYVFDPSATADVWRAYAATQEHPFKSRKLATNWHGPYLVERMDNPSTVVVIVPYKRGKGSGQEIAWRERFPLRHVRQHCQESFVDRTSPDAVWVPAKVIAKRPSADGDVEYHVHDVNAVDMNTRRVWRSALTCPGGTCSMLARPALVRGTSHD